jgi:hypothetical protein
VYLATSFLNLVIWGLALVLNPRAKRLGIWIGDSPAAATSTVPASGHGATGAAVVDVELGTGAIALDDGRAFEHNVVPTLSAGYNKPDMSQHFELKLPHAPYAGHSSSAGPGAGAGADAKAGDYSYDYSPPVTPLETPGGGYDRSSYFSSATLNTLHEDGDVGDYGAGKDGKKGGGVI